MRGARVLFIMAQGAGESLPALLRDAGATVDDVVAYRTVADVSGAGAARDALATDAVDAITFTSASTVRFFLDAVGGKADAVRQARVITMGPVTSAAARSLGFTVHAEAGTATIDALVEAVLDVLPGG